MCSTRARLMILLAAGLLVSVSSPAQAAPGDIIARLGPGKDPTWSPDGKSIALLYNGAVYLTNADGSGTRSKVADGPVRRFVWASDTNLVITYDRRRAPKSDTIAFFNVAVARDVGDSGAGMQKAVAPRELVRAIDVSEGMVPTVVTGPWRLGDGTVGYFKCLGSPMGPAQFEPISFASPPATTWRSLRRIITREEGKRFATGFGDLWLIRIDTLDEGGRRLTSGENFSMVSMSPSGDRLAAFTTKREAWVIMDTSGSVIVTEFEKTTVAKGGLMHGAVDLIWSPEGSRFTYLAVVEDADTTVAETLWLYSLKDATSSMIVSDEHGELGRPSWSPDGKRVAVPTIGSGILVAEVK